MGVAVTVGAKYLLTVNGTLDGQRTMTTFWYAISAVTGTPDSDTVGADIAAKLANAGNLFSLLALAGPNNWSLDFTQIQYVQPVRVRPTQVLIGVNGSRGNCDAPANAMTYTRAGTLSGRSRQSTVHVPLSTDPADCSQGRLTLAQLTALQNVANANLLNVTGIAPGYTAIPIISNGPTIANVTILTRAFAADTARTMKRRVVGRGI